MTHAQEIDQTILLSAEENGVSEEPQDQAAIETVGNLGGLFVVLTATVLVLWGLTWLLIFCLADSVEQAGVIGDAFGSINALFSGLAFVGLILAILLQRKDLQLQREELRLQRIDHGLTRDVHEEQQEQMKSQAQSLKRQTFDGTFLQLVGLHADYVRSLNESVKRDARASGNTAQGTRVLRLLQNSVHVAFETKEKDSDGGLDFNTAKLAFGEAWRLNEKAMQQFYRHLTSPILAMAEFGPRDSLRLFGNVFAGMLSAAEQQLLAYGTFFGGDQLGESFRQIVARSQIWQSVDFESQLKPSHRDVIPEDQMVGLRPGISIIKGTDRDTEE